MSTEPLTLTIPDSLARELDSVGEGLLVDLLERGSREFKIDQALDWYARGGFPLVRPHAWLVYHDPTWLGLLMHEVWNRLSATRHWLKSWARCHARGALQC